MKCSVCDDDPRIVALVPEPGGSGDVIMCIPCATKMGVWCTKHHQRHIAIVGCGGSGTICMKCVDEDMPRWGGDARRFFNQLQYSLPAQESDRIREWVTDMCDVWDYLGEAEIALRGILMEAHRRGTSPTKIVEGMLTAASADAILPLAY